MTTNTNNRGLTRNARPAWAISESYWRGRILNDISWQDFMRLPGVTKKMPRRLMRQRRRAGLAQAPGPDAFSSSTALIA